eukprot:78031_1
MSNKYEQPSAPPALPEFEPVDPNAIPPSYNPECMDNTNISYNSNVPQISTTSYNNGNMYGQPNQQQYHSEGQITYDTPQNIPPPDYQPKPKAMNSNQPLISNTHITNFQYTSASDNESYNYKSNDCCSCDGGNCTDKCKKLLLFAGVLWIVAAILLIIGAIMLNDSLEWNRNAEETSCTITSYTRSSCSYDCHCHTDNNGHKHCDTCYGDEYKYYVTSDMCNGRTLKQMTWDDNGSCPQTQKWIGYTSNCWVECNKNEFSFSSPGSLIAWSIVMLVIGTCCCCCGTGFSCKGACCDKY